MVELYLFGIWVGQILDQVLAKILSIQYPLPAMENWCGFKISELFLVATDRRKSMMALKMSRIRSYLRLKAGVLTGDRININKQMHTMCLSDSALCDQCGAPEKVIHFVPVCPLCTATVYKSNWFKFVN